MAIDKRLIVLATLIAVSGCATQPREFAARLASPPSDRETYARDFATCRSVARNENRSNVGEKTAATLAYILSSEGILVAPAIRSDREEQLKAQMTECLAKQGYSVSGWKRISKAKLRQTVLAPLAVAERGKDAVPSPVTK